METFQSPTLCWTHLCVLRALKRPCTKSVLTSLVHYKDERPAGEPGAHEMTSMLTQGPSGRSLLLT